MFGTWFASAEAPEEGGTNVGVWLTETVGARIIAGWDAAKLKESGFGGERCEDARIWAVILRTATRSRAFWRQEWLKVRSRAVGRVRRRVRGLHRFAEEGVLWVRMSMGWRTCTMFGR